MSAVPPNTPKPIGRVSARPYVPQQQEPDFEFSSEVSAVRVAVAIQGKKYLVSRVSVVNNAHGASDSAEVTLPLKGSPDFTRLLARSDTNTSIVPIQIYVGLFRSQPPTSNVDITGLTQLFSGQVDQYSMMYDTDEVKFFCRSLASVLIDNRITGLQRNITTTRFVEQIAKQYNLTPNVMLPKGQYPITVAEIYADTFAIGIQNWRIWDMLLKMGEFDDADVWVTGSTLNYVAPKLVKRNTVDMKYGRDIETVNVQHSPLYSKNIRVEVRTYTKHHTKSTAIHVTTADDGTADTTSITRDVTSTPIFGTNDSVSSSTNPVTGVQTLTPTQRSGGALSVTAGTGPLGENGPLRYPIYKPGMAPQAANLLAQTTWSRLSRHEYTANIRVPLTRAYLASLSISSKINLSGLPTLLANNDTYWPRRITWSIDVDSGASIDIEAISIKLPPGQV